MKQEIGIIKQYFNIIPQPSDKPLEGIENVFKEFMQCFFAGVTHKCGI